MNSEEIVKLLIRHRDMTQQEARNLLGVIIQIFCEQLQNGQNFTVPELGTFRISQRDRKRSFNPDRQQYVMLPPKRMVEFLASDTLKEAVQKANIHDE